MVLLWESALTHSGTLTYRAAAVGLTLGEVLGWDFPRHSIVSVAEMRRLLERAINET
jgi:hypothetical protein